MNNKENGFYGFAKMMYGVGQPIRAYVVLDFITADQYKEITGEDYVALTPENTSATSTTPSSTK